MTAKAKKRIPPVSKKRLAANPDLRWRNSTVTQQPAPARKRKSATTPQKPRKTIPKRNPARIAKRTLAYRKGMAAYRKSETAKLVKRRANGQCEAAVRWISTMSAIWIVTTPHYLTSRQWQRCENREGLQDHHKTYARFGGDELPEDIARVCPRCHSYLESLKPTSRFKSRRAGQTPFKGAP